MEIGKSYCRVDAVDKVTGRARYTQDYPVPGLLTARLVRSTVANGRVKRIDTAAAAAVPGVRAIYTCFDVPDRNYPTAGHPWSLDPGHQDISDRHLLNERVRYVGDEVAVVVADNAVAADRAVRLVEVEYEIYPAVFDVEEALKPEAMPLHPDVRPDNIIVKSQFKIGERNFDDLANETDLTFVEGTYDTQVVQHCHIELPVSRGYMEDGKIVIITSTQIPHIVRRVISQALGLAIGKIRVIKPYIGGGFGNKQDVLYEPLNAWLVQQLGRPVEVFISREETFTSTRTRHAIRTKLKTFVRSDGRLIGRHYVGYANNGGYASHGHAVCANCANEYRMLYQDEAVLDSTSYTVYTNRPAAGAMRGYGIPQACFIMEAHMDDVAKSIGMDPVAFRRKNMMKAGYVDPVTTITCHSTKLDECLTRGMEHIDWARKRTEYGRDTGNIRRGVGMAMFCYKTGVYPISLETSTVRMILNQDGSIQMQMGATEIGQGASTVFSQMAAQTLGISFEKIHIVQAQDTDTTPFDTGAYASRQSYVSGMAVKKTAEVMKEKILTYCSERTGEPADDLDIHADVIVRRTDGTPVMDMEELAMNAMYSLERTEHITANETVHCRDNTYAFGATFAEIEVDMRYGKIKVVDIINVHDSGTILNPDVAAGQVHGGMSMGLGYVLGEDYIYDDDGVQQNANLLHYKILTAADHPDLHHAFVECEDPSAPYGNKALGEPPTLTVAPAIRNALLHATGLSINALPLSPQNLLRAFEAAGIGENDD
ncbi:MAG: xanthine dehydrogenase molybdenum-binding subunit XdhA [Eubacteriales bacterium]|nr:xanthine dehydrogenase molybdenum-binding subunit XdhA [Eubacteriales bacterium]